MSKKGFGKFILGTCVGVGIGVLIAPQEGSKTRKELKCKIDELCKKIKELNKEDIKKELEDRLNNLKKQLEELDKEKVLSIAKEKGEKIKKEAQKLVKLAKEKGTPVLAKTADEVREKAIVVTKGVLSKLEKEEN